MSFVRYRLDLAFKEPLKPQVANRLAALENELRLLRKEAVLINEGKPNEENTKRVVKHICYHDEGKQCLSDEDI